MLGVDKMTKTTRMTKQKRVILEVLRSTTSHPTADWVYEQARKQLPDISLGTVYRNLNFLRDIGEIMELNYGSTFSRFDGNPENHYHFACKECGKVFDIDITIAYEMEKSVENNTGFQVDSHRIEFYGTCCHCKKE